MESRDGWFETVRALDNGTYARIVWQNLNTISDVAIIGDRSHGHASHEEALNCTMCDEFLSKVMNRPSRAQQAEATRRRKYDEYVKLKEIFEPGSAPVEYT